MTRHYIASGTNETKQSTVNLSKHKSMKYIVPVKDDYVVIDSIGKHNMCSLCRV